MFNHFSNDMREVLAKSRAVAAKYKHGYISTTHLLLGILNQRLNSAVHVFENLGIEIDEFIEQIEGTLKPENDTLTKNLPFTPATKKVFELGFEEMKGMEHEALEAAHIILAMLAICDKDKSKALKLKDFDSDGLEQIFDSYELKYKEFADAMDHLEGATYEEGEYDEEEEEAMPMGASRTSKKKKKGKSKTPALDTFGSDLTEKALTGKLDPVIGRDKEIERMMDILARRRKNNPIILGEPGCVLGETMIKIRKISDETVSNTQHY